MELRQIAATLWKWAWLMVLATAVAAASSWLAVRGQPAIYRTSTTLMIGRAIEQVSPDYSEFYTSQQLAQTYSDLIKREPILKATAAVLGFEYQWRSLRGQVSATLVPGTQLMEISVTDGDPLRAKLIADEITRQLMITVEQSRPQDTYRQFIKEQMATLPPKIQGAQEQISELEEELGQSSSARQMQDLQSQIDALERQIGSWQATFAQYQLLLGDTGVNVLTVIEEAPVPTQPIGRRWMMQVALAAATGLMLAVGAAFVIEYLDETLKSVEDLEKATGLTTLGAIHPIPGSGAEEMLITARQPQSPSTEAYRTLRTNLRFLSPDRPLRKVLVTSADELEGKSTIAANLAVVMAQDGRSVVLVDADLRRPTQHDIFRLQNKQGLSNVLIDGEAAVNGRLQPTGVKNLRVLTSGPLPPNASELLGSQSMRRLMEQLEGLADVVIFDMPPVLPVTDAAVLAPQVDGVLLVADAGRTSRGAAKRAVETLHKVDARLLGAAMNRVKNGTRNGYYHYHSGYYAAQGTAKRGRATANPLRRLGQAIIEFVRGEETPGAAADSVRTKATPQVAGGSARTEARPQVAADSARTAAAQRVEAVASTGREPRVRQAGGVRRSRRRWLAVALIVVPVGLVIAALMYSGILPMPLTALGVGLGDSAEVQRDINRGRALFVTEAYEEAITWFNKALELDPGNVDASAALEEAQEYLRMQELYDEATMLMDENRYDLAIGKLQEITELDPWYENAGVLLARAERYYEVDRLYEDGVGYYDAGEWAKAAAAFQAVVDKDPLHRYEDIDRRVFDSYLNDGRQRIASAASSLDIIQAGQSFDQALEILPYNSEAQQEKELAGHYADGYAAGRRGDWRRAVVALGTIYDVRADYAEGRVAQLLCEAYLGLADEYREAGELQLALDQYLVMLEMAECDQVEVQARQAEIMELLPQAEPADVREP